MITGAQTFAYHYILNIFTYVLYICITELSDDIS